MDKFFTLWNDAATATIGLFWMAFWAFGLSYLISSIIQVFVTKERMQRLMGKTGACWWGSSRAKFRTFLVYSQVGCNAEHAL